MSAFFSASRPQVPPAAARGAALPDGCPECLQLLNLKNKWRWWDIGVGAHNPSLAWTLQSTPLPPPRPSAPYRPTQPPLLDDHEDAVSTASATASAMILCDPAARTRRSTTAAAAPASPRPSPRTPE